MRKSVYQKIEGRVREADRLTGRGLWRRSGVEGFSWWLLFGGEFCVGFVRRPVDGPGVTRVCSKPRCQGPVDRPWAYRRAVRVEPVDGNLFWVWGLADGRTG